MDSCFHSNGLAVYLKLRFVPCQRKRSASSWKDLRLFPARLRPSNDTEHLPILIFSFVYFPFYHLFPPLSCVSNTFRLSYNNALTSNADSNAILPTCVLSAPLLLYPSLSLWASGTVSLRSTKQILFQLLLPKRHSASWA